MLTEKEIEVLNLRRKGMKQIKIAKKLNISQPSVSAFENKAYKKIKDSAEVLRLAKELGINEDEI